MVNQLELKFEGGKVVGNEVIDNFFFCRGN